MKSETKDSRELLLSVIVPARNEAEVIRACLESLSVQSEPEFLLGQDWELLVVDDGSTDATRRTAAECGSAIVMAAPPLPAGWTGKANAAWAAAERARGRWLLFTDADTVHEPGNLRRAIHEAERHHAGMLSYSPRQRVVGLWQRALMPLIFADLAQKYPPGRVNQPEAPEVAANGQFLLFTAEVYRRIGGHAAVHGSVLEDVELARRVKRARAGLRFRYAPDAASTHMYRSFAAMVEGWKKNLAQLFPDALGRGTGKLAEALLLFGLPLLALYLYLIAARAGVVVAVLLWWAWRVRAHYARAVKAHFSFADTLVSPLALPLYGGLLLASWRTRALGRSVHWKGRQYGQ